MFKRIFVGLILFNIHNVSAQTLCNNNEVRTEIIIMAPIDSVWKILISVENYPNWNPFIYEVKGKLKAKSFLKFKIKMQDSSIKTFSAKVLSLKKNESFAWGGSLLFFFRARHYFILTSIDSTTTKLTQGEYWKGLFGSHYGNKVYLQAFNNFNTMNAKMKAILEK